MSLHYILHELIVDILEDRSSSAHRSADDFLEVLEKAIDYKIEREIAAVKQEIKNEILNHERDEH